MKIIFLVAVLFAFAVSVTSANSKCGENCLYTPGETANVGDIAYWCSQYQEWDQKCCQCIAAAESKGNANVVNYNADSKSYDVGL